MSTSTRNRSSVDAGLCMNKDGTYVCALASNHCDDEATFMSSLDLVGTPGVHGGSCADTQKTQGTRVGICNDATKFCASVPELCDRPLFTIRNRDCTVKFELFESSETKYGSCSSSGFPSDGGKSCLWSNDDCDDMSSFKIDNDCTCEKVRVGGCQQKSNPSNIHCAVSKESCDDRSDFLSVTGMKDTDKDCYLCREAPAGPQASVSTPATLPPATSPSSAGCSIGEVPDTGCSVCGQGMCVTNSEAIFEFPGQPSVKCGELETAGLQGIVPLAQCGFLPSLITDTCVCQQSQNNPSSSSVSSPVTQPTPSPIRQPTSTPPDGLCSTTEIPDNGCSVCGPGMCISNSDAIFAFPGQPKVKCSDLESAGLAGIVPLDQCGFLPALVMDVCECKATINNPPSTVSSPGQPTPLPRQPTRPPTSPPLVSPGTIPTIPIAQLPSTLESIIDNRNKSSKSPNVGGIVGGLVGAVVVGVCFFFVARKLRRSKRSNNPPPVTSHSGGDYA